MRCIEIILPDTGWNNLLLININMRCIEMFVSAMTSALTAWLTLTWDVLKCNWKMIFAFAYLD